MEPLENTDNFRFFINPDISNPTFKFYKKAQASFWVEEEIESELVKDKNTWSKIDNKIQELIKHQVAFFIIGDGRVNQTISEHIDSRIFDKEVQLWYNYQKMMEDIHNIVYVKLADTYITNTAERKKIFDAVENFPAIRAKINWLKKWLGEGNDFHKLDPKTLIPIKKVTNDYLALITQFKKNLDEPIEIPDYIKKINNDIQDTRSPLSLQILINIVMEGLFFQGSFCIIFWYGHHYGNLPGLTKANEFISRDEGMHTDFGIYLYLYKIINRLPEHLVHQIFKEAVELEISFQKEALPTGLLNMNIDLLGQYIKFIADQLLVALKYFKIYHVENPFKFMNKQSVGVRSSDFFVDNNVSEYGHHASGVKIEDQVIKFDEDF